MNRCKPQARTCGLAASVVLGNAGHSGDSALRASYAGHAAQDQEEVTRLWTPSICGPVPQAA